MKVCNFRLNEGSIAGETPLGHSEGHLTSPRSWRDLIKLVKAQWGHTAPAASPQHSSLPAQTCFSTGPERPRRACG